MSDNLLALFKTNVVLTLVLGLTLLLFPGIFLTGIGWAPVDPILTRFLGAGLLAMAWSSFQGMRANSRVIARLVIEMQAIFYILAGVGALRQLLLVNYPIMVWGVFALLAGMAVAWVAFWLNLAN